MLLWSEFLKVTAAIENGDEKGRGEEGRGDIQTEIQVDIYRREGVKGEVRMTEPLFCYREAPAGLSCLRLH